MPTEPSVHPFPGLRPFEENEQDLFFGREGQSEEILGRLRAHRFVAVVGASGSGKSSLVRAGLLPYLHGGFLAQAGSHWRIAIFRPGGDPIKNLAAALDAPQVIGQAAQSDDAAQSAMLLEVTLRRSGLGLIEAVRLARLPEDEQVLIVVDQFEELFRFAGAADRPGREEDAAAFVKLLMEASGQRELPIYVVLTMRSDYIGDCARFRDLPEAVTKGLYLIPRMTRDQRRAAIVEPVRVGGGTIAPRLVTRLLNDVGDDPDQLPILQHALMRTWDYWQAHRGDAPAIDVEDYLAIGGMADALSQHADEAYAALPDDSHRDIAKRVFQALSEKGSDNREARRPTILGKLAEAVQAPAAEIARVLDEFRAPGRSFLTPASSIPLNAESVIDISHESLIRGWRRMRQWVEEEADSARVYRRLADTASLHAQRIAGLLRDPDLQNVLAWRDRERPNAAWGERYHSGFAQAMAFLEQSRLARDAERRQKETGRRRLQIASGMAAALITIVAVVALWQWHQADLASKSARQALTMTTDLANSLVFDIGQDPRLYGTAPDMLAEIYDRAIKSAEQVIKIDPTAAAYTGLAAAYNQRQDSDHALVYCQQAIKLDPNYARAYNNCGLAYLNRKDYDRAITYFNQNIKLDPKFYIAYVNLGLAYEAKGDLDHDSADYDRAIANYDQAIALDPKYPLSYAERGDTYYARKDYDRAIADFDRAIALVQKYQYAYNGRGMAYDAKGDPDRAIADFDQAIALDPKGVEAYNNRGIAFADKKDYDRAIADYDRAIALDPKYANAFNNRGIAFSDKKDYERAIADYDRAIALNPKYADAFNNRGIAFSDKKDYERAIADYDRAIALDPKYAEAFNNRGIVFHDRKDYDRAIADYSKAIELSPAYTLAYSNRGNTYRIKGEYDRAIADYDRAITLDPKYLDAYNGRGLAYFNKDDYDRAIADFDQALKIDPKDFNAYNNRGMADFGKGDRARAIADFGQAIALDPKDVQAYNNRCSTYSAGDDFEPAIADCNQAIALDPKYVLAYLNRGRAYLGKKNLDRAIADFDQTIALAPKAAAPYYFRGLSFQTKSDPDHAIADYSQAVSLDPKYVAAYVNRGRAYFNKNDFDRAIADFDQAIALAPEEAASYYNRGLSFRTKGDFDRAIADYGRVIALDPKDTDAYNDRGYAYLVTGDPSRAIADYTQAITLDPKSSDSFFNRGLANLFAGSPPKALADFGQANVLDPKYAYTVLWLDIVDKRSNLPSPLARAASQIDMSKWPAPVIRLYLGQSTAAQVLAAADDPDANTKAGQLCEANFYIGELMLQHGKTEDATRLFQLAAAGCPKEFTERALARYELRALGANPDFAEHK